MLRHAGSTFRRLMKTRHSGEVRGASSHVSNRALQIGATLGLQKGTGEGCWPSERGHTSIRSCSFSCVRVFNCYLKELVFSQGWEGKMRCDVLKLHSMEFV